MRGRRSSLALWLPLAIALPFAATCCRPALSDEAAAAKIPREAPITAEERDHWAYRPLLAADIPRVDHATWSRHPVDRFLYSTMHTAGLEPMPGAGKLTLLRRLTFDLTGLPPSGDQMREFLADAAPDAYERLVDRLLASPAYGERYAQHWLDLARFAETDGFEHDLLRPNAWRYRDWVIDALNRDVPFDEFISLQLAGDLLRPGDPQAAIATGFLLCGPDMPDLNLQDERRHVVLNEITSTVGAALLAMQVGCAQCHDHKFDAIRQHDFYRLRAYFESADIFHDHPVPSAEELAARQVAEQNVDPKFKHAAQRRRELEDAGRGRFREQNPDVPPNLKQVLAELNDDERAEHAEMVKTLKEAPRLPELPLGRVLREGKPREAHFYLRGDFRQPVGALACAIPSVLAATDVAAGQGGAPIAPRIQLARWLTQPDHPLTARVIVNRLWQWHFGAPLAANPSDFGVMGAEPSHPQLLDWLARRFVEDGWSLKPMHRLLVTSEAYRAASAPWDASWSEAELNSARQLWQRGTAADPQGKLLWRRTAHRLDGESLRDAMLSACQRLSARRGGPGIRPPLAAEVTGTLLKDQWVVNGDEEDHRRRGIYLFVRRNLRYPLFDVFDRPDTNASCPLRHESTTATQSLALFNSQFSLQCARDLAGLAIRMSSDEAAQIDAIYRQALGRPAQEAETRRAEAFLRDQAEGLRKEGRNAQGLAQPSGTTPADPYRAAALVDLCLAVLNSSEFVYVD